MRDCDSPLHRTNRTWRHVWLALCAACGLAFALSLGEGVVGVGAGIALASQEPSEAVASEGSTQGFSQAGGSAALSSAVEAKQGVQASDMAGEMRYVYANAVQGYSILVPGGEFGVVEQNDGAGQTVFYLANSIAETQTSFGSLYTVYYYAGQDADISVDQYFSELAQNVRAESGDDVTPINDGLYEMITLGGVTMPSAAWMRYDSDSGFNRFEMRVLEFLPNGGFVIWGVSAINDEMDVVLQALSEGVATFKADPTAYGGNNAVWTSEAALYARPSGEFLPASVYGAQASTTGSDAGGSSGGSGSTSLGGGSSSGGNSGGSGSSLSYTAVEFSDGWSFTFKIPQGWAVNSFGGAGSSAFIEAYDPSNPAIRLTYWGTQNYPGAEWSAQVLGVPFIQAGPTVRDFVEVLPTVSAYAAQIGEPVMPQSTRIGPIEILDVEQSRQITEGFEQLGVGYMISDEAVVKFRTTMEDGHGTQVIGTIYAFVIPVGYGDLTTYSVQNIYGVWAPVDIYEDVAQALVESGCGHFQVTEAYLQAQASAGRIGTGGGGTTYDPSDGIMDSYYYQQQVQDEAYQAWDDYILGRDRYTLDDGSDLLIYYE